MRHFLIGIIIINCFFLSCSSISNNKELKKMTKEQIQQYVEKGYRKGVVLLLEDTNCGYVVCLNSFFSM